MRERVDFLLSPCLYGAPLPGGGPAGQAGGGRRGGRGAAVAVAGLAAGTGHVGLLCPESRVVMAVSLTVFWKTTLSESNLPVSVASYPRNIRKYKLPLI